MYRRAQNGYGSPVSFEGKPVYYIFNKTGNININLKYPLSNKEYYENAVKDGKMNNVLKLMENWKVYENGWVVTNHNDSELFNYLTQIFRTSRPKELDYFK